ncbi:dsDNA nuclease domain-containing protein [Pseudomonas fluorescens]|jgi:hypothetical protein|uniref:dsDNA nuclease domain-containing protein n=1 Tax=Pseudomonas fluorescens TaxID=294 RepID=UPI001BE64C1B|nr:dsDNA nuclease domain-containing protein [Pseudomonas fluorescens]MBT2374419.1 DUF4297 domain-containing protein [Pseudomonas fluorescens]
MDSSNSGGVAAKLGFRYQDCAAALFVTEMFLNKTVKAVRCEVTDDIDIIYDDWVEYVQVKTSDTPRWSIPQLTTRKKGAGNRYIPESSIVHKSMSCATTPFSACRFRIVSPKDSTFPLNFLEIDREKRKGKPGRTEIVAALNAKLGAYSGSAGNDVSHWVDSTWWQVIPTMYQIELIGIKNIRYAATEIYGVTLSSDKLAESIWIDILNTMSKKSALDRRVYIEDDKTYFRDNFMSWFKQELIFLDSSNAHRKIYAKKDLPKILVPFRVPFSTPVGTRNGLVLHQRYHLGQYRYEHIAKNVCRWLDELFLRPKEMADNNCLSVTDKFKKLKERVLESTRDMETFLGKALLHSTVRLSHNSQPIPVSLFIDKDDKVRVYENVHIIQSDNSPDELWIGFSKIIKSGDIPTILTRLRSLLYDDIMSSFDEVRDKILDIKEDSYLLRHDIDEILDTSHPFDDHINRFRFLLFVGYDSALLTNPETKGHEDDLYAEAKALFDHFVSDLSTNSTFSHINIDLFLYPTPSVLELSRMVETHIKDEM